MTPGEARILLDDLCVKLGFCLPPEARRRLESEVLSTTTEFVDAVFKAEGLDPQSADRHLYRQVSELVTLAFARRAEGSHPSRDDA